MRHSGEVVRTASEVIGITCLELFYPAGLHIETHAHEHPFFALTLDGAFVQKFQDRENHYSRHGVLYQGAGENHSFTAQRTDVRCFVVELNTYEIERRYSVRLPDSIPRPSESTLAPLLTAAYRELRHRDASSWLAIEGIVLQLLVNARRANIERGCPAWLERVEELVHDQFQRPLTLAGIANEIGVPAALVSSTFRRVHGRFVADEQRRLRVEFASRRLVNSDVSLAEIALEAGFADQPHFTRTFKRATGMTPAQYRATFCTTTFCASR